MNKESFPSKAILIPIAQRERESAHLFLGMLNIL